MKITLMEWFAEKRLLGFGRVQRNGRQLAGQLITATLPFFSRSSVPATVPARALAHRLRLNLWTEQESLKNGSLPSGLKPRSFSRRYYADIHGVSDEAVFVNRYGEPLTASGFRFRLRQYVKAAACKTPTLSRKRITPHVFRHTTAI